MVLTILHVGQQRRHQHKEMTFAHSGRRRGWDDLREKHWNIYTIRKDPDAGKDWRWEEKGTTEDEMVGWHHRFDGQGFEQAPGVGDGQRSLASCSPWGRTESDTTEQFHFHFPLSCTGEGNGNPLPCSCLEKPRDGEAWWAAVYGVA